MKQGTREQGCATSRVSNLIKQNIPLVLEDELGGVGGDGKVAEDLAGGALEASLVALSSAVRMEEAHEDTT